MLHYTLKTIVKYGQHFLINMTIKKERTKGEGGKT